ncbi:PepSY-like domain-containing protein [Campylobacter jejuni]|nr:PepSY-like domain-containing protein [Campylobacter jejuni]HEC1884672.1 PepSY-like domain-containing protein [Campylobacter jejuni]
MKLKLAFVALLSAMVLLAKDMVVPTSELPKNALEFISKNFANVQIALVKKDIDSYDVILNDGTEIDFMINGDWKEVDGKYKALPHTILPSVMKKVSATQPNAQILEIDKEINGYKFKFNNNMKVYTDMQGNVLGQKLD